MKNNISHFFQLLKRFRPLLIRSKPAQIEYLLSFLTSFFILSIVNYWIQEYPAKLNPPLNLSQHVGTNLINYIEQSGNMTFVVFPTNPQTRSLVKKIIGSLEKQYGISATFVNSKEEMKKEIYKHDLNGIAIEWENSQSIRQSRSPIINVYYQAFTKPPTDDVFRLIRKVFSFDNSRPVLTSMAVNTQEFSTSFYKFNVSLILTLSIFGVMPLFFSIMPYVQLIIDDRSSKMHSLMNLMGCKESTIWIATFVISLLVSFPPNLFYAYLALKKTILRFSSFTLYLHLISLHTVSHIIFLFFLLNLIQKESITRLISIFIFLFSIFNSFIVREVFFIPHTNPSSILLVFETLFPTTLFQLAVTEYYTTSKNVASLQLSWKYYDFPNRYLSFRQITHIYFIQIVVYLILLILANKFVPRKYGKSKKSSKTHEITNNYDTTFSISNVKKVYNCISGKVVALNDLSFSAKKGELLMIIGPNGAGKSTLVNILSGILKPTSGTLCLMEKTVTSDFTIIQDYLGLCLQENVFDELLTVRENLEMFASFRNVSKQELENFINTFCDEIILTKSMNCITKTISGGQKRKLCISMALLGHPQLIIMDEPIAGVDALSRIAIWNALSKIKDSTIIATSHALDEASTMASRVMLVEKGSLTFIGSSEEMKEQFNCGYLMSFESSREVDISDLYQFCKTIIPECEQRRNKIWFPVNDNIDRFLYAFDEKMKDFGISSYSFIIEQLEDVVAEKYEKMLLNFD